MRGEVQNRWRSLGRPYLSWLIILYAIWAPLHTLGSGIEVGTLAGPLLGGEWATRPFTTFWFLSALFLVAIGMRLLDGLRRPWLALISLACLALGSIIGDLLAAIPLGAGVAIPALGLALIARVLRESTPQGSVPTVVTAGAAVPLLIVASLPLGHIDMKYGVLGTPILSALIAAGLAWAAIVLLDFLFTKLSPGPTARSWSSSLTKVAIIPVLLHPAILWATAAPQEGAPFWIFAASVTVPWALALFIARTPASPWLIGQPSIK